MPADQWLISSTLSFIRECLCRLGTDPAGQRMLRESYESLREKLGEDHEHTRDAYERFQIWTQHRATA